MSTAGVVATPAHVVVLAFPFGGHVATLHALTRLLATASRGTLFSFVGTAKCNAALAAVPSPPNLALYAVPDGCPEGFSSPNPEEGVGLFLRACPGNLVEGVERAVADRGGVPVSCVVGDCFLWFAAEVAERLGVRWVALCAGGTVGLSTHVYTEEIRQRFSVGVDEEEISGKFDKSLDFIPGLSSTKLRDIPEGIVSGNLDSPFHLLLHRMGLELPRAAAVVLNTFHALEPAVVAGLSSKLSNCLPIGPLNLLPSTVPHNPVPPPSDPSGCLRWLAGRSPCSVAYIAFGTVLSPRPGELTALAKALESSGTHFLWSLREKALSQLPEGFVERTDGMGMVVGWAPQVEVLRHKSVGAFVTHCGWNSVMEAMAGGVPMICRPILGDQRVNASQVSDVWGIGVGVDGGVLTRGGVEGALRKVLVSKEGREMRRRAGKLKGLAEEAVGVGGSSVKSLKQLVELVVSGKGSIFK